jgi:RNA polymerase sigma-70 factor (ECF subfamily)
VAQRLALQARGLAERRRCREHIGSEEELPEPCDCRDDPLAEATRRELRLVLDEELGRLPEKYRAPVVLCYLEGRTNEQAAEQLGWPAGSMSRRLARARALLHDRLSRRGLAFVVVLCCLLLGAWLLRPAANRPEAQRCASVEDDLRKLAEGRPAEPGERLRLAQRIATAAETLQDHNPGRDRQQWRRLTEQMRRSARDLAEADDEQSTSTAARRLSVTCQTCHASFRD